MKIINESELLKYIDKDQLIKRFGGSLEEPTVESMMVDNRLKSKDFLTDELISDSEEEKLEEDIEDDSSSTSYRTIS